jgi:type VI secretion system protein ImpE
MSAHERYQAGDLGGAIAEAVEEVKRHPGDPDRRGLLCELLCFAGELERADTQLDALAHQNPGVALGVSLLRQLVRAELARRQFHAEGRVPEFLEPPGESVRLALEASIEQREGRADGAADRLARAEALRPRAPGLEGGRPFDDFRDLDDLTAGVLEVLTSNGKYYWIPIDRVELVEFRPPERIRDLLWRRARMVVRGGPDGEVYLPVIYAGTLAEADDQLKLGRATDWRGGDGTPVRGVGQRTFLVGEEARPILELGTLEFHAP